MAESREDGWLEVLDEIDKKHQSAHDRLRLDFRKIDNTVQSNYVYFDNMYRLADGRLNTLEAQAKIPVDATKLVLSTKAIIGLVGAVLVAAASYLNLSAKIEGQQRVQDIQITAMQQTIKENSARTELLRMEVQTLKETILTKGRQP